MSAKGPWGDTRQLLADAHRRADAYAAGIADQPVFPSDEALAALAAFDEALPEKPTEPAEVLALLDRVGSPGTVAQTAGRYYGFVNGGALPVGLAARWLGDAWDQNTAHQVMSPVGLRLEETCERWLAELFGLPAGTAAGFVTGTMTANLSAMAAARNELLRRQGWDAAEHGLWGAPPMRVIVGAGKHAAIDKALSLLGMGSRQVTVVPTDEQGAMRADALPELDERTLVCTQAGNVNSGAFDPTGEICDRAREAGAWVHVDGAFGLWAAASRKTLPLYAGTEKADSWAVDAHKTLNAPYDCGIVLVRSRESMLRAFEASAQYFQWGERRDGMSYTPSMSKRARAVELWAILKSLGRSGVERLVDQLCAHARHFAERLAAEGFRVHNEVVFNQVLVSCGGDELTRATLEGVQRSGECWCGASTWRGEAVIRVSVCSWATSREDVERSVAAFVAARG